MLLDERGQVKLADFGLAAFRDLTTTPLTDPASFLGTPLLELPR